MADQDPMQQANDMNDLIAQAAQVQADLQKAQEEILAAKVEGSAGNGLVKVTMTGGAEPLRMRRDWVPRSQRSARRNRLGAVVPRVGDPTGRCLGTGPL